MRVSLHRLCESPVAHLESEVAVPTWRGCCDGQLVGWCYKKGPQGTWGGAFSRLFRLEEKHFDHNLGPWRVAL